MTVRTAVLRKVWRQSFFLVGYFLKLLATLLSAVERRISPERRTIVNHDAILRALPDDSHVHASDQRSVVVKKIDVRPSGTLRDQDGALVGPQDEIDDFRIGYGDLSEWALAMNCRREALV